MSENCYPVGWVEAPSAETRRHALSGLASLYPTYVRHLAAACFLLTTATLANAEPRHGLSSFGDLKYPPGFAHYDYVNPSAPKGGRIATRGTAAIITFDSFNPFILKGDHAQGLPLLFDTLMTGSSDEPDSVYGLVAETADVAADRMSVTFRLRAAARFSDGSAVTADDIAFTFKTLLEKGHPAYRIQMRDVSGVEVLDPLAVRFTFKGTEVRDLPLIVAGLPVLSKAYYSKQPFDQTTLEPPLGSGPYKIGDYKQGTFVAYTRREDYWARDLNVNRGRHNFDEVRYEYFRDRTAELQNLFSGALDLREEFTSKDWATAYDVPPVTDGRLLRVTLPDQRPSGAQGFFLNTRRAKLADWRVRKALDYAFDFEWMNKNLFYGLYKRTSSFFENSPLKSQGVPPPEELALLEPFRKDLPPEVFGEVYVPPVSDGSGTDRRLLRESLRLLAEAGWKVRQERDDDPSCGIVCRAMTSVGLRNAMVHDVMRNDKGEQLELEFLIEDPSSERILLPYVEKLRSLGIAATIRRVDPAQYERRRKSFDFDIIGARYVMGLTPSVEMRGILSAEAAATDGTQNLAGIRNPAVDALIGKVIEANTRAELITASRALDRVLRAGYYWVPNWYKAVHNIAHWDKFSRPAVLATYSPGILDTWWYDPAKAARIKSN